MISMNKVELRGIWAPISPGATKKKKKKEKKKVSGFLNPSHLSCFSFEQSLSDTCF